MLSPDGYLPGYKINNKQKPQNAITNEANWGNEQESRIQPDSSSRNFQISIVQG